MKNSVIPFPKQLPDRQIKPPPGLSREAGTWWKEVQTTYRITDGAGLLLLRLAAEALTRMRLEERSVKRRGSTIRDRFGQLRQNPAALNAREARGELRKCLKMLNLDLEPLNARPGRPSGR